MLTSRTGVMKCPRYEAAMARGVERSPAAESRVSHPKASPLKEPPPIKPACPPVVFSGAVHNKENSTGREHDRTLDDGFEDSGYLSLHNSHIEDDPLHGKPAAHQERTSPSKCPGRTDSTRVQVSLEADRHRRRTSSNNRHPDPNLPIVVFQRAVCEELAKSFQKNKRYDWSIVSKVAEHHLLDRVIGGKMGREHVDVFSCLLSRSMRNILVHILSLLGDHDLISCKKVSRSWRRIVCDDSAARRRCQRAEQERGESSSSPRRSGCGLTRDVSVSRVVLSCMQTLATSTTPSSSTPSCRVIGRTGGTPTPPCDRFSEYQQAAGALKQHESLRPCRRCGSPAVHSSEVQRATCTRPGCRFDFCTRCREAFHGSTPCRVVRPRPHLANGKTPALAAGATRSRRTVRRL
uniref:F-box protein 5 n=1 Tax=Gasterosteus aculeatus aculeatus TaxID=481459 RepID=G3N8Q5_GASAC